MTKRIALVVFLIVGLFMVAGVAMAQDSAKTETAVVADATAVTADTTAVVAPVAVGNKICPVSGMEMVELGKDTVEYEGKVYNLCSPMCKEEFLKDPAKYIAKVDEELAKAKEEVAVSAAEEL